jgi:hypothetical protein
VTRRRPILRPGAAVQWRTEATSFFADLSPEIRRITDIAERLLANFPEFHNVYIEPGSYEIYKQANQFPEGTIMFKELQLTQPGETRPRLAVGGRL